MQAWAALRCHPAASLGRTAGCREKDLDSTGSVGCYDSVSDLLRGCLLLQAIRRLQTRERRYFDGSRRCLSEPKICC